MKISSLFPKAAVRRARHSRFALGTFVLLLLIALCGGYAIYRSLVEGEERKTEQTLNQLADMQSGAISAWMMERMGNAKAFSGDRFMIETMQAWLTRGEVNARSLQRVQDRLKTIKATYQYLDVCLSDLTGNTLLTTEGRNDAAASLVERETAQAAIAAGATVISSVSPAAVSAEARREIYIATPLVNRDQVDGQPFAVLMLVSSADHLLKSFVRSAQLTPGATENMLVEVRGGRVVAIDTGEKSSSFGDLDTLPLSPQELAAAAQWPYRSVLMQHRHHPDMTSVVRKIDGAPWYLITMIDRNATHRNVDRLAWMVVGSITGLLSLLGMVLLFWWKETEMKLRLQALQANTEKALLQRQYDFLSKYANDIIVLTDCSGRIIEVNDKTTTVLGRSRAALIGAPFAVLLSSSSQPALQRALEKLCNDETAVFEVTQIALDGSVVPVEISARAIERDERKVIQMIGRDISERRQSEAALQESRDRLNGILGSMLDVVWSFSPDLAQLHYINPSVEQVYGYPPAVLLEHPRLWFDAIHPEDRLRVEQSLTALSPAEPLWEAEYRILGRGSEQRWLHSRGRLVCDGQGLKLRIDGGTTDITKRKVAEQQVQLLAYYDSVTMLPNRRLLHDRLAQSMHMAMRSQKKVALLYMDLDNFKNINDSLGHQIGDMLLREIAERLLQCVREEDTVARIGGDEFIIVLPDIERSLQVVAVAEKILASTARPILLQQQQVHTTISIGISIYPDDAQEANALMQYADSALYQAKSQGRDNYQFFTPELNRQIMRSSSIEHQLREALDAGDISLWYQPQIDADSGALIGAEALLRWRGKDGISLSPVEFIPVAEERGLIGRIGEWALREACAQCRRWQLQGLPAVPVAVNVSPLQFQQKGFAALVTGILADTGLDPTYLELEITESAIMRRAPLVAQLAMRLRDAGVGITIDDFGTGYSSLSYLKQIPIDKIKIDRSFITDMLDAGDNDAITRAIVNLAHSLNLRVVAEGVETGAQIDRLRLYGCDEIQGYYYSAAVSAQAFERFLANQDTFSGMAAMR